MACQIYYIFRLPPRCRERPAHGIPALLSQQVYNVAVKTISPTASPSPGKPAVPALPAGFYPARLMLRRLLFPVAGLYH
jgi:hypothetical protein